MNTLTHNEVINYLRTLGREISRRAEELTEQAHPMAAHFETDAATANTEIEAVVSRLLAREAQSRAEFDACQPGPRAHERENFNTP